MNKDQKKAMIKVIIAILILIVGIGAAIYFGGWIMFIKPILAACAAFAGSFLF